jgi:hypothetical protein
MIDSLFLSHIEVVQQFVIYHRETQSYEDGNLIEIKGLII